MHLRPEFRWRFRSKEWTVGGATTRVMGILNATPDSFSDGGRFLSLSQAVEHGLRLVQEGADILDIGGESSRPGAEPVSSAEEEARVIPVIRALRAAGCAIPISVDTRRSEIARKALEAGADIVNDITALSDPDMARVACSWGAGLILMHMQGAPRTMQDAPQYGDVVAEVGGFLSERMRMAMDAGVAAEALVVDPGIGFGKTDAHNLRLIAALGNIPVRPSRPWLLGVSRKRVVGHVTGRPVQDRLAGSLALAVEGAARGAAIIRAHDVKETCDVLRVADRMREVERAHAVA